MIFDLKMIFLLIFCLTVSTTVYLYLKKKTRMNLKYIFIDNVFVAFSSFLISYFIFDVIFSSYILAFVLIPGLAFSLTMIRFWRTPKRKVTALENEIISPADGNIIYIKKIEANETPISIKKKSLSKLSELTKTNLLSSPCWLIGINMTPFDVHSNCAPIDGKITLNKHTDGKFLSLKDPEALTENERNTYVIEGSKIIVGVIQIASKKVRRIDSYVKEGQHINKGNWLGMIRFGSQVDLILPDTCTIKVKEGQQVYAIKTTIAEL